MRTEEQTPLWEQKLILIGRVEAGFYRDSLLPKVKEDIARRQNDVEADPAWKAAVDHFWSCCHRENSIMLMHHYAYADIPYGRCYDVLGEVDRHWRIKPQTVQSCPSTVLSFLMKYRLLPLETAPHGHSALCLVEFTDGIPPLLNRLELFDGTKQLSGRTQLFLSSWDTVYADIKRPDAAL